MVKQILALELKDLEDIDGHYLIDVRTPEEWDVVGRPDGEALGLVLILYHMNSKKVKKESSIQSLNKRLII